MTPLDLATVSLTGRTLIEASAGTGKTFAIATLYVRCVFELGLESHQILVVTFTEAATAELRGRIRARLRDALAHCRGSGPGRPEDPLRSALARAARPERAAQRLRRAVENFDRAEISTIHGFCQRRLGDQALATDVGYRSDLEGDPRPRIRDAVLDFWARETPEQSPLLLRTLHETPLLGSDKRETGDADELALKAVLNPNLQVLPQRAPEVHEPVALEGHLEQAFEAARRAWSQTDVIGLVRKSSVNRRSYNERYLPQWAEVVGAYFARGLWEATCDKLEKFCRPDLVKAGADRSLLEHPLVERCSELLTAQVARAAAQESALVAFKLALVKYVRQALPERSREAGVLSFDDLLQRLQTALSSADGAALAAALRARYPVALIDEFQDTDPVQCDIFERIYPDANAGLYLIGDPKQAIYSFRGADIFTYVAAKQRTPALRQFTLNVNRRSDPALIRGLNRLFGSHSAPFLLAGIEYQAVAPRPEAYDALVTASGQPFSGLEFVLSDGTLESEPFEALVAGEVAALLERGLTLKPSEHSAGRPLAPSDIAVLTRTNQQSFQVQDALRALGIPAVVLGERSVYETDEAEQLLLVLSAVANPGSLRQLPAALGVPLLGLSALELERLEREPNAWEPWLERVRSWHQRWMRAGFVQMMDQICIETALESRLLRLLDGERRLTNLRQLIELLQSRSDTEHLGPTGLLAALRSEIANALNNRADERLTRLESDALAVKITTCHRSKGLEYPVVLCPHLWRRSMLMEHEQRRPIFQHPQLGRSMDLGSADIAEHVALAEREAFGESLRLGYVGLTRARHLCMVFVGSVRQAAQSALGYWLHAPAPQSGLESPAELLKPVQRLGIDAWQARLEALAQGHELRARPLLGGTRAPVPAAAIASTPVGPLTSRTPLHSIDGRYRVSSFSALTAQARGTEDSPADEGAQDHEQAALDESVTLSETVPRTHDARGTETVALAAFEGGAQAGRLFHEILEQYAFESPRPGPLATLVSRRLAAHHFDPKLWTDPVCQQLFAVLDTPLPTDGRAAPWRLADISLRRRLNELEFWLPICGETEPNGAPPVLRARDLANALMVGERGLPASYLRRLQDLDFLPLRGFVRGFIDLVVEHEGRYFVIDYKSNRLGLSTADYGPLAMQRVMSRGHYYLQYHLYTLAAIRHLSLRVRDFDYDRHFGGVYYLFIRGMGPTQGEAGVFFDKPPQRRLQALAGALGLQPIEPAIGAEGVPSLSEVMPT
jgi:exodeoxyribonuclease V beta subunit